MHSTPGPLRPAVGALGASKVAVLHHWPAETDSLRASPRKLLSHRCARESLSKKTGWRREERRIRGRRTDGLGCRVQYFGFEAPGQKLLQSARLEARAGEPGTKGEYREQSLWGTLRSLSWPSEKAKPCHPTRCSEAAALRGRRSSPRPPPSSAASRAEARPRPATEAGGNSAPRPASWAHAASDCSLANLWEKAQARDITIPSRRI